MADTVAGRRKRGLPAVKMTPELEEARRNVRFQQTMLTSPVTGKTIGGRRVTDPANRAFLKAVNKARGRKRGGY
jgi:hypothetical protein